MPLHPCRHPGCRALLRRPGFCQAHGRGRGQAAKDYEAKRLADPALAAAKRFRSSVRWKKVRTAFLLAHPLCADPFHSHKHRTATASQVHHIQGLATHPHLATDWDNLMAVCTACHARLERAVRGG